MPGAVVGRQNQMIPVPALVVMPRRDGFGTGGAAN